MGINVFGSSDPTVSRRPVECLGTDRRRRGFPSDLQNSRKVAHAFKVYSWFRPSVGRDGQNLTEPDSDSAHFPLAYSNLGVIRFRGHNRKGDTMSTMTKDAKDRRVRRVFHEEFKAGRSGWFLDEGKTVARCRGTWT